MSSDKSFDFDEFLASDFAAVGEALIKRCMKMQGRRLYLSGATGFFGKNLLSLLAYLARQGATFGVTALSRSPERFLAEQSWSRNLAWLDWQAGDVGSPWPGEGRYDYVIHAATETAADFHRDKLNVFEQILSGTRNSMAFAAAHGVRRVLLTGSGAQYGAIPADFAAGVPESSPNACDPSRPNSAYGEAKRAGEMLAALHGQKHGIDIINTRCFAFVGPGLPLDAHFAIGNFIGDALRGTPIQLATGGDAMRSYLYGADLAVWLLLLLIEADNGSVVNVGSGHAISILDLAGRVRDVVSPRLQVRPGETVEGSERHYYVPCVARAKALGLDVWTDLDRAIERTALWHRSRAPGLGPEMQS